MRRAVEGRYCQLLQRAHLARLCRRPGLNAVHQQADGEHRVLFINVRIRRHVFAVDHVGFDSGELQALARNVEVLALRDHFHRIGRQALGVGGRFEGDGGVFFNQVRVGHFDDVKIAVVAVFVFDKAEALFLEPGCDRTVHCCYRLVKCCTNSVLLPGV